MEHEWVSLESLRIDPRPILKDITIVIPTLGRAILEGCLYWIALGNSWPGEIIVVDQGNNPQIEIWLNLLTEIGIRTLYLPSQKQGKAAGINCGFREVKTRFVVITDDDCFVGHDWLSKMSCSLRNSPDRILTGRVEPAGNPDVNFCVVTSQVSKVYQHPQLRGNPFIGGNFGVAMDRARYVGFFDEGLSSSAAEDSDWGYRALRKDVMIEYNPEIVLYHYNWRNSKQRANRYRDYSRGQGAFYGKYLLSGDPIILLKALRDLVRGPIRWLRGIAKGDQDMIDRGKADSLELIGGILAGLRRRNT